MKKVLMIADTYYPDSRATIQIAQRIAEEMVNREYEVAVLPLHLENKNILTYPKEHKAVSILEIEEYSCERKILGIYKRLNNICYRIAVGLKKFLIKNPQKLGHKWNGFLIPKIKSIRTTIYENPKKNIALLEFSDIIRNCLQKGAYDVIISVALPFDIHYCVCKAIKGKDIEWIATNFDPYAFDELLERREVQKREVREARVYSKAKAVLMLSQFYGDYEGKALFPKIHFVELPNIRPLKKSENQINSIFNSKTINCAFIGNLYGVKRNPGFIFELFEKISNKNIHLYVIGTLIDISKADIEEYCRRMGGRLHYLGRVGQQEAIDAMFEADVLINVGHTTTNQCPSKVLDYMSTGKPILHISKNDRCSSLPYLKKYGNWFHVKEKNGLCDDVVQNTETFIMGCKGKQRVPFAEVRDALPNCTIEKYVDVIEKSI